jgi:hypothetical protein
MMPGQGQDPAHAEPAAASPPPGRARAETYLRLRAEAELRRALALPRVDPPAERGVPVLLRTAARLALPLGRRAAGVVQPLADTAARTLQPLADNAARTLQPLADNAERALQPLAGQAARTLQPLADSAARTLQPLAGQAIRTMLPLADDAARRLHPLAWQAADRLQALQHSGLHELRRWRWRAYQVTAARRGARADAAVEPEEPSADEGLRRLRTVAHALAYAGAIDSPAAESVLTGLETALVARSRIDAHRVFIYYLRGRRRRPQAGAPAGPYLAGPIGVTVRPGPESGLAELRLFTLVIAPDQAVLTAAGRLSERAESQHQDPWPVFSPGHPSAIDDRGNSYQLHEDSGRSDSDGEWAGILRVSPIPKAGIRWLELTFNPGSPGIRVDLTGSGGGSEAASGPVPAGSPAERLIDAVAVDLLQHAVIDGDGLVWHASRVADIVTALDAVDALAPARDAVGRLVMLAGRLGVDIPSALSAAAEPRELPAAWISVLDSRHRQDGPRGDAAAAAVLPELDGARFALAGLRSDPTGADLNVLAWGWAWDGGSSHLLEYAAEGLWSWSARDDRGRWHIAAQSSGSYSDSHANLQLRLVPPLHPDATSLEVTLAGPTGQVTATVPLDWQDRA